MRSRRAPGTLRLSPITAAVLTAFSVPVLAQAEPAPQQLDALQVIGERPYSETESASPKLTEPLRDTPRTVNILTSDLLEEQGRRSLVDALRNITGIAIQAGEGNPPGGDQFKIRGFLARDAVFVDGARQPGSFYRDPFNTETIEVIKGPAGAFTGAGSAGGSVNLVSKQPMLDHFTRSEMGVGSDSQVRAAVDVNHALGEST
jgi:catecholate siderophore receptor